MCFTFSKARDRNDRKFFSEKCIKPVYRSAFSSFRRLRNRSFVINTNINSVTKIDRCECSFVSAKVNITSDKQTKFWRMISVYLESQWCLKTTLQSFNHKIKKYHLSSALWTMTFMHFDIWQQMLINSC